MSLRVEGVLSTLSSPQELQTVADMLGMQLGNTDGLTTLRIEHLNLRFKVNHPPGESPAGFIFSGTCAAEHSKLLVAFTLALSADGIVYAIKTYNQENILVQSYQSN